MTASTMSIAVLAVLLVSECAPAHAHFTPARPFALARTLHHPRSRCLLGTPSTVTSTVPYDAAVLELRAQLAAGTPREVCFNAFVVRRRPMGSALIFLDLVSPTPGSVGLQAAFKAQAFADRLTFGVNARILQPGTLVRLCGVAGATRTEGESLLVVSSAKVLAPALDLFHVAQLIRAAQRHEMPRADVAAALRLPAGRSFDEWLGSSEEAVQLARDWRSRMASGAADAPPIVPAHVLAATDARVGGRSQAVVPPLLQQPPSAVVVEAALRGAPIHMPNVAGAVAALDASGSGLLVVEGYVQGRRRFAQSMALLDCTDEFRATLAREGGIDGGEQGGAQTGAAHEANWEARLRLALHPAAFGHADRLKAYSEMCAPGARIRATGVTQGGRGRGDGALWVTELQLLRASWQPRALARILAEVARGTISAEEAGASLLLDGGGKQAAALADCAITPATQRQWELRAVSARLQGESSRMGTLTRAQARVLAGSAPLRERWPVTSELPCRTRLTSSVQPTGNQLNQLEPGRPGVNGASSARDGSESRGEREGGAARTERAVGAPLAAANGFPASRVGAPVPHRVPHAPKRARGGSWWEGKKRPQIEFLLDLVEGFVAERQAANAQAAVPRPLSIVDIGGGKGSLASALVGRYGSAVLVHVVDVASAPLANGAARATERGLSNLRFVLADASEASLDEAALGEGCAVDLVVALHACGALSDVALAQAVRHGAGFVVCPCCFGANGHLRVPVGGPQDAGSEGSECGAGPLALPASEWLGVEADAHAALLHAAELQGDHRVAADAAHAVCALRAEAATRQWQAMQVQGAHHNVRPLDVHIVQFPLAFSTRNHCLVGVPSGSHRLQRRE